MNRTLVHDNYNVTLLQCYNATSVDLNTFSLSTVSFSLGSGST